MATETYNGLLVTTSNGEESHLLGIVQGHDVQILAELVSRDRDEHGRFLSVSYYTSDKPVADPQAEYLKQLYGGVTDDDVEYRMRYSDITGYLWTDEKLTVGGHDLIEELRGNLGRYLYMTIEFSKTGRGEDSNHAKG
jgi:hypothetical protein